MPELTLRALVVRLVLNEDSRRDTSAKVSCGSSFVTGVRPSLSNTNSTSLRAVVRCFSMEPWTRSASHFQRCCTTPLHLKTRNKKKGQAMVVTKDNHEEKIFQSKSARKRIMRVTDVPKTRKPKNCRMINEFPHIHTNNSNALKLSCVRECAIARCMSHVVAAGRMNLTHDITILFSKPTSTSQSITVFWCVISVRKWKSVAKHWNPSLHSSSGNDFPTVCKFSMTQCCHR
mmetsp:Transcript_6801/g.18860  ORF Transcript_6801/g.18860 Transcript_6801/m.18860 type:complete len:231 (+) Transcript_6801:330-1022(+)